MRFLIVTALWVGVVLAQSSNIVEIAKREVPGLALRIPYGKGEQQFGELRLPDSPGPHPLVVLVHGGCWVASLGNLPVEATAMQGLRPMAADLAARGIATWNLEYRRLGHEGGGWPGTFQDLSSGADYVRELAKKYKLDLDHAVVAGHSAGGHFALWLAGRAKIAKASQLAVAQPVRFRGALNLDGPGDLRAAEPMAAPICGAPVITQLIGGTPAEYPERYRAASPAELLPIGLPQEVFAGRMFASLAPGYEEAAKKAGDSVRSTVDAKGGHFEWIDPRSEKWSQVLAAIDRLLGR